ncbi:MAG: polyprenyl synthetase family protein [Aquificaceae bacterium]|nr:MAG: polyprenyl synthetase family protein [Aquificaceae bacterium]
MGASFLKTPLVERFLALTEEGLKKFIDSQVRSILEVGNYIVEGGGKRLRPLLVLLIAKGGGLENKPLEERVVPLAVGIEYIHTASLLHDDVVDNAQTRRGRPSAHTIFGNAVSVLTGDYMYATALYLYSVYGTPKMIEVVSNAVRLMAEGQVLELKKVGELIDEKTYFEIIDGKTAVLFGASSAVGALASPNLRETYHDFWNFGVYLGRAFQLIDDALDYEGSETKLGKPVGQDLMEGKTTYPLLAVLEKIGDTQEVKKILLNGSPEEVKNLVNLVRELGGVEKTKERARKELSQAREILNRSNLKGEVREILNQLVDFVAERTY